MLALILAALALPAAAPAACHHAGMPAVSADGGAMRHAPMSREDAAPTHGCIGCIPLGDWLRAPIVAPLYPSAPLLVQRTRTLDLGRGLPPALPPPRQG